MTVLEEVDPGAVGGGRAGGAGPVRLDLLRAFVVLSEDLHYTRAAGRLFLSQPGLSRQIRQLEASLGAPLVRRSTRTVELTAAGRALLPHAVHMLATYDAACAAVRQSTGVRDVAAGNVIPVQPRQR